jgi:sugar phosphate isomerase/epimerase
LSANKIGICEWSLPLDGPYACKLVADLGFDGLQIDVGDYHRGFSKSRPLVRDAYMEMAEKSGIQFPSMAARVTDFYTMFPSNDKQEADIVRSGIAAAIGACRAMNISTLLIPNFEKGEITGERQFAESVEVFQWACDEAGGDEIVIAAENTLSAEDTHRFLSEITRPNLKPYFDTQNYYLHKHYDTPKLLDQLFEHVCEIHVKDGKGRDLPGQLANQILQAVIWEAVNIVQADLAAAADVDTAIKMGMGLRFPVWGPLEHIDALGLDLALSVQKDVLPGLHNRAEPPGLLEELVSSGSLEYKSGKGLYDWSAKDMDRLKARRDQFIIQSLKHFREEAMNGR